jgi:hypothetical protein
MASVSVENNNRTVDEVLKEAVQMYKSVAFSKETDGEKLYAQIHTKHLDFCRAYPIVAKLISFRKFSKNAFKKYLLSLAIRPWKGHKEFLESQAEYMTILAKETTPGMSEAEEDKVRKQSLEMITSEQKMVEDELRKMCSTADTKKYVIEKVKDALEMVKKEESEGRSVVMSHGVELDSTIMELLDSVMEEPNEALRTDSMSPTEEFNINDILDDMLGEEPPTADSFPAHISESAHAPPEMLVRPNGACSSE